MSAAGATARNNAFGMILVLGLLTLLSTSASPREEPVVIGVHPSSIHASGNASVHVTVANVGTGALGASALCNFSFIGGLSNVVTAATLLNASTLVCVVPPSPYRLVPSLQHREPWRGCVGEDRCMAHRFTLSVAWLGQDKGAVPAVHTPEFTLRYYMTLQRNQANLHSPPPPPPPPPPQSTTAAAAADDAARFQAALFALNHPRNCSDVDVFIMERSNMLTGIGMVFYSHYLQALRIAYESNRVLVLGSSILDFHYLSDRASLGEVYIRPPSNCSLQQVDMRRSKEYSQAYKGHSFFGAFGRPKAPFAHRDEHWLRAQLVRYWVSFSPLMEQHLSNVSRAIGFHAPCVGVHVRRGERGNVGFKTPWLANYPVYELRDAMSLVGHMANTRYVFLATDEPKFFAESGQYPSYNISFDQFYKRAENGRDCVRERIAGCTPGLTAATVTRTIWSELHFISRCSDGLVATMTSTFSKLAADLVLAYHPEANVLSLE